VGVAYTVLNHDGTAFNAMKSVGDWTVDGGLVLTDTDYNYVWPTVDGSKPDDQVDVVPCPAGSYGIGGSTCVTW
jgi:hypothetical protein